jgi:insulysin
MLDKELYSQLRTREQLGYIVAADVASRHGAAALRIVVQSALNPAAVHARVEAFLAAFRPVLADMDAETFAGYVDSLITKKLEKDRTLQGLAGRLFDEIVCNTFSWHRRQEQVEQLRTTTKAALLDLYDAHMMPGAPARRKLTAFVVGKATCDHGAFAKLAPADAHRVASRVGACDRIDAAQAAVATAAAEAEAQDEGGRRQGEGAVAGETEAGAGQEQMPLEDFVASLERFPCLRT